MRPTLISTSRLLLLLGVLLLIASDVGRAQVPSEEREGTASIEGWPRSLHELLDDMGRRAPYLLPRIDSLALDYRYAVTDSTSRWSFVIGWQPAERVLYEGDVLPWREGPDGIRMTNVEFRADVRVDGEKRAEMIIGVDSMALRSFPDRFVFNVTVRHDRVFLDTPPRKARQILSEDIVLDPLVVERMGFSAAGTEQRGEGPPPDARRRRDEPTREPSIYPPGTHIHIGWRVAPRPYYVGDGGGDDESRTERPRGDKIGRSSGDDTDRSRSSGRGESSEGNEKDGQRSGRGDTSSEEEDEDEDDTDLRTPALVAVAAVGLVAVGGGTVGVYGRGDTPIGLASGYTRPEGGVQLQAAVNSAVIEGASNQKLSLRALGFYDVFSSRIQPAVGLGVQVDPGNGDDVEPALSGGLVGNLGRFVLYGGFDVVHQTPEIGLAYNFRSGGGAE